MAKELRVYFPEAKRGLQYQEAENCPDITGTPYHIETKRYAKEVSIKRIDKWFMKALEEQKLYTPINPNNKIPVVVIFKADHKPIDVYMSMTKESGRYFYKMSWKSFTNICEHQKLTKEDYENVS